MRMGKVELKIAGREREAWHLHQPAMERRTANLAVLRADWKQLEGHRVVICGCKMVDSIFFQSNSESVRIYRLENYP